MEKIEIKVPVPIKEWYKSKIVLAALAMVFIFLGMFLSRSGVTDTQLQVLQQVYPDIADAVKAYKVDNNLFAFIGALTGGLVAVFRVWFTTSVLPQSLPEKEL